MNVGREHVVAVADHGRLSWPSETVPGRVCHSDGEITVVTDGPVIVTVQPAREHGRPESHRTFTASETLTRPVHEIDAAIAELRAARQRNSRSPVARIRYDAAIGALRWVRGRGHLL
jgi:hypothetical protein